MMPSPQWSSRLAFILTAASFAVGVGNIWRFPYMVGTSGGGAFLVVYIFLAFLIAFPILLTEMSLGRMSQTTPLVAFGRLSGRERHNGIGWISVVATFLILGFYVMIMSWIALYTFGLITGKIFNVEVGYEAYFTEISTSIAQVTAAVFFILILSFFIISKGLQNGIEKLAKIFMPILLILIVTLGIWSSTRDGAAAGIRWYLQVDFSEINAQVFLAALSQLFFSIGIGMTAIFTFGSYTSKKEDIIGDSILIIGIDTVVAFLAGFMIFPLLFSFGVSPDSGPSLLFVTMTNLFTEMPGGRIVGSLFFLLLFGAGLTSVITSYEGLVQTMSDKFGWTKKSALIRCMLIGTLLTLMNIFSQSGYLFSSLGGRNLFGWTDMLANSILLPVAGLLMVIFSVYIIGYHQFSRSTNQGSTILKMGIFWKYIFKIILPISILVILLYGLMTP